MSCRFEYQTNDGVEQSVHMFQYKVAQLLDPFVIYNYLNKTM